MIAITPHCRLDDDEIFLSFVRSGGKGGQNVNKVSTAAQLRFNIIASPSLPSEVKQRLLSLAGNRVTSEGEIVIHASSYRTQERNRADALDRLVALIRNALRVPKKRKKSKPTWSSRIRRFENKKQHAEKKKSRRLHATEFE
jgi:ribosome-associated protein